MRSDQRQLVLTLTGGLLPIIAVIIATAISVAHQRLPDCQIFFDGCVSISRAVRQPESLLLFRVLMTLSVATLFWFWARPSIEPIPRQSLPFIRGIALIAIGALLMYVWTLGTDGRLYAFMRRVGIFVFFGGTLIAQLLAWRALKAVAVSTKKLWMLMLLTYSMFALGLIHLAIKLTIDSDAWENRFEWWIGSLLSFWYVIFGVTQYWVRHSAKPSA